MDRRTLAFVFGMTAIFFLMNQWFYQDRTVADSAGINQPATEIQVGTGQPKQLSAAEIQSHQLFKLFRNIDQEGPYLWAVERDNTFLGLRGEETLSEETYYTPVQQERKALGVQRVILRVNAEDEGNAFLYTKYPLQKLRVPWIPSETVFPVSLVYFDEGEVFKIKGTGTGFTRLTLNAKPPRNGLLFYESEGVSEPYGVYIAEDNKIHYIDHIPRFEDFSVASYPTDPEVEKSLDKEEFYVLENEFIQLVVSNLNGALAEINLPFHSETHPNSVVNEVEFDRILARDYPFNDTFPQRPYSVIADGKKELLPPKKGGYYPLLRRDILGFGSEVQTSISPHYYAMTIFETEEEVQPRIYSVTRFEKNLIELEHKEANRKITKTIRLPEKPQDRPYTFDMDLKIDGDARHLYLSMGIPEVELISGSFIPTLKYRLLRNGKGRVEEIKPPKTLLSFSHLMADWYCDGNGFFGVILDPLNKSIPGLTTHPVSGELVPSRISLIDAQFDRFPAAKYPGYAMHTPVLSKPGVTNYRVFAGPFDKKILQTVDNSFIDPLTGGNPDFLEAKSSHGWFSFISQPFAKFLFIIMNFFHTVTGSWGISIILLTIVLRVLLFPLTNWSMKSMARMQQVTPKLKEIQEKYKKDPKRVQLETMNLYRKEKVNPFGGCFPILIQLPFLFGMLDVMKSSFPLRGASFIPGWINDLSAPDVLFSWSYPIPFIGTSFHLLPILLGVAMVLQSRLNPATKVSGTLTDQQRQQKFMSNIIPIFMTFLFYKFPSGLNIYWLTSTLLGIVQQWLVNKKMAASKK
ncbi:MAG: membrane protein insertase YidC [Simkaniaceae bacterium]|nr:membrane protein insertase YidC [Candidatus Sacchlamyda saccharinae]